ncbi:PQQ-dependent sugar dehydrogenase [Evansella sp. AB-P1]|uniref:PQQ-dependent sugar dehydrogenase n=1 Tax=Evansella sp. AB-P1 TaxID=3037653 RepID=UPI00241E8B50|nr:PQQ-dependent sugar dehydrogenase [Evansella sp. AB-P1]MDG5790169.1 PQQ-dependent sugar dehydrogenase [Evansella sp. AB-P1]
MSPCQFNGDNENQNENNEQNENNNEIDNEDNEHSAINGTEGDWEVETVAENLQIPWDINHHHDTFYITEREGYIVEIALENNDPERIQVETSDPIMHVDEGGLLGMALAPNFEDSGEVFLYYTYLESEETWNKVVKAVKEDSTWVETQVLLDNIPGERIHNGGRMAIGPDNHLYITTGDANQPHLSQENEDLAGNILRMTLEGAVPEDNPFEDSYVYSYGHRNPQGIAWNDEGQLYSSEHGPAAHDEINIIEAGKNYGWPHFIGDDKGENIEEPLLHSADDTWAPSGITFWNGNLLAVGLRGESLYKLNEEETTLETVFTGAGRIRDVLAVDDNIYIITNNTDGRGDPRPNDDRLLRLTPAKGHRDRDLVPLVYICLHKLFLMVTLSYRSVIYRTDKDKKI